MPSKSAYVKNEKQYEAVGTTAQKRKAGRKGGKAAHR